MRTPFVETAREGLFMADEKGRKFLDCSSGRGIFNLGRRPASLVAELVRALDETDQGNFPMLSEEKANLAEALARFCPGKLECAVFSVMRGEAFDVACKVARGVTGRHELVTVAGGWYGETGFALSLSDGPVNDAVGPLLPGTRKVPFGDLEAARRELKAGAAAFLLEPVQVESGCRMPDAGYLSGLRHLCDQTGTLLVCDETQSGFGRTGWRFACERSGVTPDILILGEALGAGIFPIAATMLTPQVNRFFEQHPMIHLSTFGGSDLGCRVAVSALAEYEATAPWENAAARGEQLVEGLARRVTSNLLQDVSGAGLLMALRLPSAGLAAALVDQLRQERVFAEQALLQRCCVLLRPPLVISAEEIDGLVEALARALEALEKRA